MIEFLQKYFINPIYTGEGYNIYNTLAYAIILILAAYGVYRLLKKMKIEIDRKFFLGILPFVAMGGALRALQDSVKTVNPLLVTPIIYIVIFFIALGSLIFSRLLGKKIAYYKTWFAIGIIIDIWALAQMKFINFPGISLMLAITASWAAAIIITKKIAKKGGKLDGFLSMENMLIIGVHMFDATTTFVSLQFFPYFEQHVVPSFFIGMLGPGVMFALKLPIVVAALYVLDDEFEKDSNKKNFFKILILILGMGPGLRNFLRLGMGV